jgi:glycosyltransferase involved in cell wall biosynthesis
MRRLADRLGLGPDVTFTGRLPDEEVLSVLSTADVCLAPDPRNPLNDVSTMNKVVEYMAVGRPVVAYDLREARVSAGAAARYANGDDERAFADCIDELLDDPAAREEMGRVGLERLRTSLSWERSEVELLRAYDRALAIAGARRG